jgi:hypothetical protein
MGLTMMSIAAQVGIGFWITQNGTKHWFASLTSIATGIVAASQFSAAMAIDTAADKYAEWMLKNNQHGKPTIDYVFDGLALTFAILQSDKHEMFVNLIQRMMTLAKGQNMDKGNPVFVTGVEPVVGLLKGNQRGINFGVSGPEGPERLQTDVISENIIYKQPVIAVPPFKMDYGRSCHPFTHPGQVGEYITSFDETPFAGKFEPSTMNRSFFVRGRGWVPLTIDYMVRHLCCWNNDAAGTLRRPASPLPKAKGFPGWWMAGVPNILESVKEETYAYYPFANADCTRVAPGFPQSRTDALRLVDAWLNRKEGSPAAEPLPFNILILQPHINFWSMDGYWMLDGGKVVVRLRKPGQAVVSDSVEEHIHRVHVKYQAGAAVVGARNLVRAKNIFILKVLDGASIEPIHADAYYQPNNINGVIGDLIFIPVPPTKPVKLETVTAQKGAIANIDGLEAGYEYSSARVPINLNMRGIIDGTLARYYSQPGDPHVNSYPGYLYCDALYGWSEKKCGEPNMRKINDQTWRRIDVPANIVCRPACFKIWSPHTQSFSILRDGNGYWKREGTYSGAEDHRNGGVFVTQKDRGLTEG